MQDAILTRCLDSPRAYDVSTTSLKTSLGHLEQVGREHPFSLAAKRWDSPTHMIVPFRPLSFRGPRSICDQPVIGPLIMNS